MAQPTQEYPPWLTPLPQTIRDGNGVPISTSTTILYLPLTYYGPSIPLGAEWTYGGLTPPASTVTTTVIPSSSTSTPTATPTTSSTSTSSSPSSVQTNNTSSASPTISSTPVPANVISHNQLIGVIVGAVIGAFVILLALFVCFLLFKNRRRQQHLRPKMSIDEDYVIVVEQPHPPGEGSPRHSGDERASLLQAHAAGPSGQPVVLQRGIPPQEGVAGSPMRQASSELGFGFARPGPSAPRMPVPTYASDNSGTSGSSTEMSSLGDIVPNSRFSALSPLAEEQHDIQRATASQRYRGPILSPEDQRRVEQELHSELAGVKDNTRRGSEPLPLSPPPRPSDPEQAAPRLVQQGVRSSTPQVRTALVPPLGRHVKNNESHSSSHRSSYDPDDAALVTAQRVKGARPAPYYYSPLSERQQNVTSTSAGGGGLLSSIGSRLSWFKNLDAVPSSVRRRSATPKSVKASEKDTEANMALLSPTSDSSDPQSPIWSYQDNPSQTQLSATEPIQPTVAHRLRPGARLAFSTDERRPVSGISGRSGASSGAATTYFDANSSFPSLPVLTPPPRAMTPVQALAGSRERLPSPLGANVSTTSLPANVQSIQQAQRAPVEFGGKVVPAYDENDTIVREHSRELASREEGVDVLDMPAPSALTAFRSSPAPMPIATVASTSTAFSHTDTVTSTTVPTLFSRITEGAEGTLSTTTSDSSLRDSSNVTAGAVHPKQDSSDSGTGSSGSHYSNATTQTRGGAVEAPSVSMVRVPPRDSAFGVKEAKSWSEGSTPADSSYTAQGSFNDPLTSLHSSSRETNRTNITGTTLAAGSTPRLSVDLLEDEPPMPGEGWRSLANVIGGGSATAAFIGADRRFTLGMRLPQDVTLAELGSLQAMRSHLSPVSSNRSTGSAAASRREMSGSTGSRSSRPSAQHSLSHSGSISSSEGRRRYPSSSTRYRDGSSNTNHGTISPALSAFGSRLGRQASDEFPVPRNLTPLSEQYAIEVESGASYYTAPSTMASRSTTATRDSANTSNTVNTMNSMNTFRSAMSAQSTHAALAPALMEIEEDVVEAALRAAASSRTHVNGDREFGLLPRSQTSDVSPNVSLSSAPWAAGLGQDWNPL